MKSVTAHRVQSFAGSGILSYFGRGRELEHPVDLSIGVPYGEMTKEARDGAVRALREGQTRYTPPGGVPELRAALAQKLRERNQIEATPETTIVTAGVSGGLFLAMAAILDPGDEIIIPDPFFVAYRELPVMLEATPVFLDTYPSFELNLNLLESLITPRTKAILINSPNNPSGTIYDRATLERLAAICRQHELIVISDEIYEDFVFSGEHFSIGSIYQPTITLNGFSKNHAMTGIRIGYAHSTPEIIHAMTELALFVFFANSSVGEQAALAALDVSTAGAMEHYATCRDLVIANLDPAYERSSGDGSFFFLLKHPKLDGREVADEAFKQGLIVIPGEIFSLHKSHFRISYAVDQKTLAAGIEILNAMI